MGAAARSAGASGRGVMAELKENSILFSLDGLFERERERVSEAAERERRRTEAEQLERLERERRLLEQEEQLLREQEARAEREEQRRRDEASRIEALREAEIARACAEAEAKARIEIDGKHREHELRLESIREKVGRRCAEQVTAGCAIVAVVSWVIAVLFYFGQVKPERERARAEYETVVGVERDRSHELRRLLEVSQRRNAELASSLKRTLEQPAPPNVSGNFSRPGVRRDDKPIKPPKRPEPRHPCRDNGDPMDDCL